jgi:membrane protein
MKLAAWGERVAPRWWRILRITWLRRGRAGSNIMAAAIGFYALICIGPLGLLMAWALQLLMGQDGHGYEWLRYTVNRIAGEAAATIMSEIDALITHPDAHIAGVVSAVVLVWAGLRLFEALEISLTRIWPGPEERGLVARKLVSLASMIAAGALLIVAILLTAFVPTLIGWLTTVATVDVGGIVLLQPGLRLVVEVAVAFAAFFLLFKFIPAQHVTTRVAAVGAVFTALAWRAVTPIFTLTVARSAEQSAIYGGLAGVVMFLTWAFFGAHVLLLGAHLSAAYEHVVCHARPRSLDDSFIRLRPEIEEMLDEEDRGKHFHGPTSYPPPGHV